MANGEWRIGEDKSRRTPFTSTIRHSLLTIRSLLGNLMAQVTLKDVKKVYAGGVEAVKGVTFDVPDGHFCVLVGPSGCGKSTLLRMVAGVETISSGEVRIGERVVNEIEPSERDIAMVFQNYALYPHMRVYDNMAYGLRNRKTPKDEIETRNFASRFESGSSNKKAFGRRTIARPIATR